jgi:gamma-polyglutamate biosynthesis protein CapC
MTAMLSLSIGLGLVISLLFTEVFGLAVGGMIVPGYVALSLTHPVDVVLTLTAGLLTFVVVHSLSTVIILYGRRRTVLTILVGFMMGTLLDSLMRGAGVGAGSAQEFQVIGFIIPGLIALWLDRQGVVETILSLVTASAVVRLLLVLFVGMDPQS